MSMEMVVSIVGVVITILTLGIMVRSGNKGLEQRLDARITANSKQIDKLDLKVDGVEASLTAKIDGVAHELSEFRLETKTTLARHDERLAAIERQRPHLLMP